MSAMGLRDPHSTGAIYDHKVWTGEERKRGQKLKEKGNQRDSSHCSSENSQAEKKNLDSMKNPELSQKSLTRQEAWDKVHSHLPLHFINEKFTLSQQLMPCSKPLFIPF